MLETREIADAELDAVSGGLAHGAVSVQGGLAGAVTSDVANAAGSLQTVGALQDLAAQGPALASGITGVNVNTSALTGLAGV